MKKVFVGLALGAVFGTTSCLPALAQSNYETCTSPVTDSYFCTSQYDYHGEDPYDIDRFITTAELAPDGTKHSCTSFAAYIRTE
jgi:hypothetical protein